MTATTALVQDLLDAMAKSQADFTLTFRRLSDAAADAKYDTEVRRHFADPSAYDEWAARWRQRMSEEPQTPAERAAMMRTVNPAFIPRNHRIEAVIQAAIGRDDFAPFEELLTVLAKPYEDQPAFCNMPTRRSRISACSRHSAEHKSLTLGRTLGGRRVVRHRKLRSGQSLPSKSAGLFGGFSVDALVFEFMGLAMLGLCVIVLAVPSTRRPAGRQRHDF